MDVVTISKKLKNKQHKYAAQNGLCYYCLDVMNVPQTLMSWEIRGNDPTYEHIIPRSKGGIGKANNRVLVHLRCNIVHGRMTSYFINVAKRSHCMDEFIEGACRVLYRECSDYNDACQYASEIVADVMEKYASDGQYTEREVTNQVQAELVRTFACDHNSRHTDDNTGSVRHLESRMSRTD